MKPENDVNKLSKMGRRRFMENLGALGVSATTLNWLSQDELADVTYNPEKEVPYVARWKTIEQEPGDLPIREPEFETIPRDEWVLRQTALDVRSKVGAYLDKEVEAPCTAGFVADEASPTGFGVQAKAFDDEIIDYLEEDLPTTMDGFTAEDSPEKRARIPINVRKTTQTPQSTCYNLDQDYSNVPGGAPIYMDSDNISGTLTAKFYSLNEAEYGWTTAGHVADSKGDTVHQTHTDGVDIPSDPIGTVKQSKADGIDLDYAYISPSDTETVSSYICKENNTGEYGIFKSGAVTTEKLQNEVGNTNYKLITQGTTTCRTDGYVTEIEGLAGPTSVLTNNPDTQNGDSGGPTFEKRNPDDANVNDEAYIASLLAWEEPNGEAKGTLAKTIEDKLNGFF